MKSAPKARRSPPLSEAGEAPQPGRPARGGRPRKGDEERISAFILEVAFRLFARQGFAATSIEQVAATSGVGRDTIYRRYASKEELLQAAAMAARLRVLTQFDTRTAADDSALERLRSYARQLLTFSVDPDLVALKRISFHEMMVTGRQPTDVGFEDPLRERLVQMVEHAQEEGSLRRTDPAFVATQLFYAVAARPSLDAVMGRDAWATGEAQDEFFEKAWDHFCHGVRPRD